MKLNKAILARHRVRIKYSKVNQDIKIQSITLSPNPIALNVGDTVKVNNIISPSNASNKKVEWVSGDSSIFTIDNLGNITGIREGNSVVYCNATDQSNVIGEATVTVAPKEPLPPPIARGMTYPHIAMYPYNYKPFNDEDVVIKCYFTDFYQQEYIYDEEDLQYFDIRYEIDGVEHILKDLPAGETTINLGKFTPGMHWFSVQAIDKNGVKSYCIYKDIYCVDRVAYPITEEQTYRASQDDLNRHGIKNTNSLVPEDLTNTRWGLTELMNEVKDLGYRKLVLPTGIYRVDNAKRKGVTKADRCVRPPSNFTLDLNGSTLKLHPHEDDDGCTMELMQTFDTTVCNGIFEGDYFERREAGLISGLKGEGVRFLHLVGSRFSTFENITLRQVTGYAIMAIFGDKTWATSSGDWLLNTTLIDGNIVESDGYSTSPWIDISKLTDAGQNYFSGGVWLGYGGLIGDGRWLMDIHYYDANKNFLTHVRGHQYRQHRIPTGATYARVVYFGILDSASTKPVFYNPPHSSYTTFKNMECVDTRTCAFAPAQFHEMHLDNVNFTRCAVSITPLAIDLEDGWENGQDFHLMDCTVKERAGTRCFKVVKCANATMQNCHNFRVDWHKLYGMCMTDCTNTDVYAYSSSHAHTAFRKYTNCELGSVLFAGENNECLNFTFKNCTTNGSVDSGTAIKFKDCTHFTLKSGSGGGYAGVWSVKSTIKSLAPYMSRWFRFEDCLFSNPDITGFMEFSLNNAAYVERTIRRCTFDNQIYFRNHNYYKNLEVEDSIFKDNMRIVVKTANEKGDIVFRNCVFKKNVEISLDSPCYARFENCIFEGEKKFLSMGATNTEFVNCIDRRIDIGIFSWKKEQCLDLEDTHKWINRLKLTEIYQSGLFRLTTQQIETFVDSVKDVDVYELTGEPTWWNQVDKFIARFDRIKQYNDTHEVKIKGVVFDVEPWAGSSVTEWDEETYANTISQAYQAAKEVGVEMVMVTPFWLEPTTTEIITQNSDKNIIMNYNITIPVKAIKEEMEIAKRHNKAIYSAAETKQIDPEHGVTENVTYYYVGEERLKSDWKEIADTYKYDKLGFALHDFEAIKLFIK